jgi:hypothetical protein
MRSSARSSACAPRSRGRRGAGGRTAGQATFDDRARRFAVASRATIQREVLRLSLLSAAIIVTLLLVIYRSLTALALGLLPVVSGALAAIAAVSLGFGEVHGLTLGFGTTLIGEAVDYSIYLFIQSEHRSAGMTRCSTLPASATGSRRSGRRSGSASDLDLRLRHTAAVRLSRARAARAVLGRRFDRRRAGHALRAADLLPRAFRVRDLTGLGRRLASLVEGADAAALAAAVLAAAACVVLFAHRDALWNRELARAQPDQCGGTGA